MSRKHKRRQISRQRSLLATADIWVLDSGFLIKHNNRDQGIGRLAAFAETNKMDMWLPVPVVEEVWRDPYTQARMLRLIKLCYWYPYTFENLKLMTALQKEVITKYELDVSRADVSIVVAARAATKRHTGVAIVTSDPKDIRDLLDVEARMAWNPGNKKARTPDLPTIHVVTV